MAASVALEVVIDGQILGRHRFPIVRFKQNTVKTSLSLALTSCYHYRTFQGKLPFSEGLDMTKPHHKLKKANHGARPANAKTRKLKRKKVRT